jgi:hypothetical protein
MPVPITAVLLIDRVSSTVTVGHCSMDDGMMTTVEIAERASGKGGTVPNP